MSFEDFLENFRALNVCRVRNWQETRIRGKFLRLRDDNDSNERVISKFYYELDIQDKTNVFIGLH
jgi:hypothetical protein